MPNITRQVVAAAFAAIAATVIVALPASGADPVPTGPVGTGKGVFQAVCSFSHRLSDDPIVFPRGPGASHPHDFFGARTTDAFSTPETIRASPTTCVRPNSTAKDSDRSAYWVPTLYVNDQAVQATQMSAYYKAGIRHVGSIAPFPEGLQVIAGSAKGGPQEVNAERVWGYLCPGGALVNGTATTAPTCKTNLMELAIRFPDCWDGANLDSLDHKSHMAYSRRQTTAAVRTCPSTHPQPVPMLELTLRYPTVGGSSVKLASGAINTAHADFVNGWDQARQAALVRDCLNADKYCGGNDAPVASR